MKLDDAQDPETYLYIKVLTKVAGRFKVGDYVKLYKLDCENDDNLKWDPTTITIAVFKSKIDFTRNINATIVPIYKVVTADSGYIEVAPVNPAPEDVQLRHYFRDSTTEVTGYSLRDTIEDYCYRMNDEGLSIEAAADFITDKFMKLDEDYTDSLILECEYKPYANSPDYKELVRKVNEAREREQKELYRIRALKGHNTRRRRKEMAIKAEEIKKAEEALAKLFRAANKAKTTKKKKKIVKKPKVKLGRRSKR